jgi:nucleotide-binding universal stress UspA family protein
MQPTLDRILSPVDESPLSVRAFEYAVAIAKWRTARLNVLEVIDWTLPPVAGEIGGPLTPPTELIAMTQDRLGHLIASARRDGVSVIAYVESGRVVEQILQTAATMAADLIVMGTHGRGGFQHLVLGSVTEKVIRRAPCPVLTVPPGAARIPDQPFQTILCATDLSGPSIEGVHYAQWLADKTGARLILAHVIEVWPFVETSATVPIDALRESLHADARKELTRLAGLGSASGRTEVVVVEGRPKQAILSLAADRAVDFIVMGVAGRGSIDLALLGSTTHHIIRFAACPVLTVRQRSAEAAGSESPDAGGRRG